MPILLALLIGVIPKLFCLIKNKLVYVVCGALLVNQVCDTLQCSWSSFCDKMRGAG